jgi:DNA helicase-2/ATP-dependent DNA helicase PcrA
MDVSLLLDNLNEPQRLAVSSEPGHMLVLAGAGSGKTRVLVHRMAWLMRVLGVSSQGILAVTFTNKAAHEMRSRIEALLQVPTYGMWVGTFHGISHRLLRAHYQEAGLPEHFQVLDSDDQLRLIKRIMKGLEVDDGRYPPRQVQHYINQKKDEGLRAAHVDPGYDVFGKTMHALYVAYEENCQRLGLVDFAELLLRSFELWRNQPALLKHYRERFSHILVDEFQDTNAIQYAWLKALMGEHNSLIVVGDDDQSIYGWRGAKIENIQRFLRDFPDAKTVRLEQNYRSTQTILEAANQLIRHNGGRMGKELWTEATKGELIDLYEAFNETDEAHYLAQRIQRWVSEDGRYSDVAVLYRSNAQSRVIEDALIQAGIPYRVYGGLRFFERAEIKDALAYLRMMALPDDDTAFERVVNVPPRGIGERTLELVRIRAREHSTSLWTAAIALVQSQELTPRASRSLQVFIDLIVTLTQDLTDKALYEQTAWVLEHSDLLNFYRASKGEKSQAKVENLEELITAARQFEPSESDENLSPLQAFLSHAALESGDTQAAEHAESVQLMTLHTAKGLEFPLVFLCGLEEGLFPHQMAMMEGDRVEEERRLCYVGMTRAMKKLVISYATARMLHGRQTFSPPSRFIEEIPAACVHQVRASRKGTQASSHAPLVQESSNGIKLGARVRHPKFGEGVILAFEGDGAHARVQVNFKDHGQKWLVMAYAKLESA